MCPVERRPDGDLTAVIGASRTGKSALTIARNVGAQPLLVWDPEGTWPAMRQARAVSRAELIRITSTIGPAGRLCYIGEPTPKEFEFFCRVAWMWVRLVCGVTIIVEELADVTHPGKAPPAWGVLIRRGLKYGPHLWATTQSPQESDKTVLRNATRIVCFLLEQDTDQAYMSRRLGVPLTQIAALQRFQFLEKIRGESAPRVRSLTLPNLRNSPSRKPRR